VVGLPASCPSCGLVFEAKGAIELGEGVTVESSGNRVSCPRCGAMANMVEGTFTVRGGVLRALTDLELTRERLADLGAVARLAQEGAITADIAAGQLGDHAPPLKSAIEAVPAPLRKAFVWVLLTALSILAAQWLAEQRDDAATPADVQRAVERALREHDQQRPVSPRRRGSKVGRNDPCPCGSGRKYKVCCGHGRP
jgi:SEC-C motif-containing protein